MARSANRLLSAALAAFLFLDGSASMLNAAGATTPPPSASNILQELCELRECGSVLYIAAHPDDENTQFIAYLAKERAVRVGYLSLTRGEGGQDLIGPEIGDPLGVIRTQELLAARRIDGGQQFFTRAKDFGFSKNYEQTLAKWDRQAVLADVVRVIREFQPDVIVTRFPPEPGNTHGHHTASTVLALEGFKLAGDPKSFPEQLAGPNALFPWQPKRIFWNAFRGGSKDRPTLRLDIGGYIPLLGESVGQIAALSRSSHRSQGYGTVASYGSRLDEFQPLDGQPAGKDLFDGIDTSWARWQRLGGSTLSPDDLIAHFDPLNPAASVPALLALRKSLANARGLPQTSDSNRSLLDKKISQLGQILQACLGLYAQTTVPQAEVVPGEPLKLRQAVMVGSSVPVRWEALVYPGDVREKIGVDLHPNQPVAQDSTLPLPPGTPLSQPYWLREEGTPGMYRVDDPTLIGRPENPPVFPVSFVFAVGGQELTVPVDPLQITADPAKGEIHRPLDVIPPVSLAIGREVQLFAPGSERKVAVEIRAFRDNQIGTLTLNAPAGWKVTPESQPCQLASTGDHASFTFSVTAPPQPGEAFLTARATIDGKTFDTSRQEIRYEHIPPQLLQPPARVKAVCLDLQIRGKEIGYLPGAGDRTAEAITAMGYHVTSLAGADLTPERLRGFDAVVIGVRAFNVRTDLAAGLPALFAYVDGGGNVIEQYNTPGGLQTETLAPYDLKLSPNLPGNRVTNENAPVTLLAPDHPAFNTPNKITPADFAGWVQERGLNFPSEWDQSHFTALLACSDPGEAPLKSGLLVAHPGKGYFVYTGLSFFRQLPAGVPGAYRLFANLISLGK
jgi:LmbE family N-acetylglucosaminyl deacetylase